MGGPCPSGRHQYLKSKTKGRTLEDVTPTPQEPAVPVQRLNHAVLYVRDVERSLAFYRDVLGFRVKTEIPGAAVFLQAEGSTNDHDLGLFQVGAAAGASEAGRRTVGLYHLAWEVDTLAELARVRDALLQAGALVGASDHVTTKALYAQDPDGLEFEVSWLVPAALITPELTEGAPMTAPLDLDREIARYGGDTRGGVGISVPA
jgi:catechol 2,3-dioxygenase-like lactoylglutathione lyase family enzyme